MFIKCDTLNGLRRSYKRKQKEKYRIKAIECITAKDGDLCWTTHRKLTVDEKKIWKMKGLKHENCRQLKCTNYRIEIKMKTNVTTNTNTMTTNVLLFRGFRTNEK